MKKKVKAVPNYRRPLMLRGVQIVFYLCCCYHYITYFHMECSRSEERIGPQYEAVSIRCNHTDNKRN